MRTREQKLYLDTLKRYERKFERQELDDYKMFVKRDKDEEELDSLSLGKLKLMYEKYHINRVRKNLDDLFKKPTDSTSDS